LTVKLSFVSGAILAGGKSSRFGRDKALHVWNGKTLLEHAAFALEGCAERFVVGGGGTSQLEGIALYPDPEPHQGSLYGLARALELARFPHVAVTACDMPNLSAAYWDWLAGLEGNTDIVIPSGKDGDLEPLAAIYSRSCLPFVRQALEAERLKMTGWWEDSSLRVTQIPWLELEARFGEDVFLNANTLTNLER
jgi:molybdenum cofactor guanylyltransferase